MMLYEIIQELVKAGHDDIWIMTSDNGNSYNKAPGFPGSWLHPKIVSRDGRVLADRIAKPDEWALCGDWKNVLVRPQSVAPYQAISLRRQISSVREKAVLEAILLDGDDAPDKKRL